MAENQKKCRDKKSEKKKQSQAAADLLIPTSIVDAIEFNAEKHMLGSLCKNRHDYQGTRQSLRRKRRDEFEGWCVYCQSDNDKERWAQRVEENHRTGKVGINCPCQECMEKKHGTTEEVDFDTEVFRLGQLCEAGHEWKNSGKTLRSIKYRDCPLCVRMRTTKRYYSKQKTNQLIARIRYRSNREAEIERGRQYREANREKVKASDAKHRENNRLLRQARANFLAKTPDGRIKNNIKCHRRRARIRGKQFETYTCEHLNKHYEQFNMCCAYCGIGGKQTIDHVVPIAHEFGRDMLSNIVSACRKCNCYMKRDESLIPWYKKQPFFDSERLLRILFSLGETELKVVLRDALDACSSP
jgi:hypothetical protein